MELDKGRTELKKIEEFSDLKDKEVLEIGCGDGRVSGFLAGKAKKLTAIDPNEKDIEKAKSKVKNVDFRVGTGEDLEFDDETFDTVMFTLSLHHNKDCKKAISEAYRVLRKGGQLVVLEPVDEGEVQKFFTIFGKESHKLRQALEAIDESDFELEKKETFSTDWVFEDKEELYDYYFNYYKRERDSKIIEEMNKLLGEKSNSKPIKIKDTLTIFSLKKKQG